MADCVVVGGGVIGLLTASVLSTAGAEVTLLERRRLDEHVDALSTGVLSPLYPWREEDPVTALMLWSQAAYPDFLDSLGEYTGLDLKLERPGLLVLDPADPDLAMGWADRFEIEADCLHGEVIARCAPGVRSGTGCAVLLPDVLRLDSREFMSALGRAVRRQGVDVRQGVEVRGLARSAGRVTGAVTGSGIVTAEQVVICTGVWVPELLRALQTPVVVEPVLGLTLLLRGQGALPAQSLVVGECCLAPTTGGVLASLHGEREEFHQLSAAERERAALAAACEAVPSFRDYRPHGRWAARRPMAPGGVPYVAPHPELSGLFVNAGHGDCGFVSGLASAHLLLDLMTEQPPMLAPEPYVLERAG